MAFINCDEAPGYGRVPIAMDQLNRFSASRSSIAGFVSAALGFAPTNWPFSSDSIRFATIKGRYGARELRLGSVEGQLLLLIGGHHGPLDRLLSWTNGVLHINMNLLRRMANRKIRKPPVAQATDGGSRLSTGQTRKQSELDRNNRILREGKMLRETNLSWPNVANRISRMTFITRPANGQKVILASTIRRILTELMRR